MTSDKCNVSESVRAADGLTPLKLFLVLKSNEPVRELLFYILKYEPGAKVYAVSDETVAVPVLIANSTET